MIFFFQTASSASQSDYDTAGSVGEAPPTGAIADPELDELIDRAMDSSSSEAKSESTAAKRGRKRGRPPKVASAIDRPRTATASSVSSHRFLRSDSKAGKR